MNELFQEAVLVSMFAATVRIATPLLLAALGELVSERAGVLNLGVEGTMLMGAFTAFLVTFSTGSPVLGLFAAIVTGGLMSLIMVFMAATLKVEQVVTGMALNLLASGVSLYWYKAAFAERETSFPTIEMFERIEIPGLARIPWIGEILFSHQLLTYIAFVMVFAVWFFLYRTKYGLEIRCIGENPRALDMKGPNVMARQYAAVIFGGMMAGLGGSFLTISSTVRFFPEISGGRGWLAIVIVIAGNWKPRGVLFAALLFAFLEAFQLQMQGLGVKVPYQLFLALPYIFAIVALAGVRSRSEAPKALGIPYFRE